ncbi:ciliogenesis and planar polarity effector 1 [Heptranchias perlo]|uniref:ciliogenesis and planar polarity effector 1 n=1 Tax=Heptranchias perlo TaxID=212740 RepID=UPI00355A754F
MHLKLEVLLSTSIKHKKPWPHFHWIGQDKEAILLSDDQRLSVLTLSTGRTQRRIPKLQPLLKNVLSVTTSDNGAWLAGVLSTGELFLWNKDGDCLKTVATVEGLCAVVAAARESGTKLFLFVSRDGKRVLLVSQTGPVFLWESNAKQDLPSVPGTRLSGRWAQVMAEEQARLPQAEDKDSTVHAVFLNDEVLGDCCFCSFVFISGEVLVLTTLELKWFEQVEQCISAVPFSVRWVTQTHLLGGLVPRCDAVKSRGALRAAFSRDGLVLALIINQNDPKATQVLFVNPLNCVTVTSSLRGCGSNGRAVPVRFIRSYWVGEVSWTHDDLFLACMLKRGALLLLSRLGELVTITTFGCSVEFGPAEFIPLHPLITYRQPQSLLLSADPTQSAGSSASESDPMRQRFSLAAHPRLPYLIVSDGYMFTVLRFAQNVSASSVLKMLLLEVTQGLDDVQHSLISSEHKDLKCCLQPSLRRSVLQGWEKQEPGTWTSPPFLQDEDPVGGEADEGDDSDDGGPCPAHRLRTQNSDLGTMEQGRLEFASMFDTVHAKQGGEEDNLEAKLRRIQNGLLSAWSVGVSVKGMEGRDLLLQYTVRAFLQFARLLPIVPATLPSSVLNMKNKKVKKALRRNPGTYRTLQLLRYCLTALYWDTVHKHSLPHAVSLSAEIVNLILSQKLGPASFSQSLLSSLLVLKLASVHLNAVYTPQSQVSLDPPRDVVSDSLRAPVSHPADPRGLWGRPSALALLELPSQSVQTVQLPSHRLAFTWRLLYQHALQHQARLRKLRQRANGGTARKRIQREQDILISLLSQIQAALQTMGERLGPNPQLRPLAGEEHFLLGSYLESVQIWRAALQGEMGRDGGRVPYLQTRYSLAILYTHLYLYNLSAAWDLGEQFMRKILKREGAEISSGTDGQRFDEPTLRDVGEEAALAVIQSLARFMALYFTNQPLFVFPPHHIETLPPLHFKPGRLPRVVPLQQHRVADAVREQHLCAVWSVESAVHLMLVGRLIPEAVWLALELGDWKTAVVLGLAFNLYQRSNPQPPRGRWRSLHLPPDLHPSQIFQDKLQALLGRPVKAAVSMGDFTVSTSRAPVSDSKQFTDSIEEEDADLLFGSVQEILKAAVMADADVLAETFDLLMQTAKDLGNRLTGLVPDGLYLPAPPLYCPQPACDSEGGGEDPGLSIERAARQNVSGVLQRVLLLFRAARCSLPAAHWYITKLRYSRKIMNKIRGKAGLPPLCPFPDSLLRYGKARSSFFRPGAGGDGTSDLISVRVIGSFRDLCGLCWMFHVREQLSESCRKYQMARDNTRSPQDYEVCAEYDAAVVDHCLTSLDWACRMLPFARFMNVEELVQDVILSLIGELPPIRKVAEILVRAFPDVDDVRVPLRDKYHALQQRLRHSTVRGPNREEMMSVLLHDLYRQRLKTLKRVVQNIGPTEHHIWERGEESLREPQGQTYDRFSLGTSLSRSTLTDTKKAQNQSDGDTTDNMSEEFQDLSERQDKIQQQMGTGHRDTQSSPHRTSSNRDNGPECRKTADGGSEVDEPRLPVTGSWEFEREDEEYVKFLELFLSYLLERDRIVNEGPGIPLLTSCSDCLKEQELNSLAFHVHTTLKRRQSRTRAAGTMFRTQDRSLLTPDPHQAENPGCGESTKLPVTTLAPGPSDSTVRSEVPPSERNIHSYFPAVGSGRRARGRGLFGLKLHSLPSPLNLFRDWMAAPNALSDPARTTKSAAWTDCNLCPAVLPLAGEDLAPELEARFQDTAKLLEWMIRWSERRLLSGPHKVEKLQEHSTAVRVKTSVPAILHSLWLLDRGLGAQTLHNYRDSERQFTVAPVYQPEQPRLKLDRESSVDTGYPGSLGTPVLGLEADVEGPVEPFLQSNNAEDLQKQNPSHTSHHSPQELTSDSDSRTDEEESADGQRLSPQEQGDEDGECSIASVGVYEEEEDAEPRACTPISPCISINIKPKPRTRMRDQVDCSLDMEGPRDEPRKEPGEEEGQMEERISKEPEEEEGQMEERISKEPEEEEGQMEEQISKEPEEEEGQMEERISKEPGEEEGQMEARETARGQIDSVTGNPCSPQTTSENSMAATESPGRLSSLTLSSLGQTVVNCQSMPNRSSVPPTSALPGSAAAQPVGSGGQAGNTSEVVRHMLQDEMFKLVQLQQINFMSLMQVVGLSLTSLPSIQQPRPVLSQNQTPPAPNPSSSPAPSSQAPAPGQESETPVVETNLPVQRSSSLPEEEVAQDPEELSLRPRPEGDHVYRLYRTPDSQSLPPIGHVPIRPHLFGPGAQLPPTVCQLDPGINTTHSLPLLRLQPRYELRAPPMIHINLPPPGCLQQPTPREAWVPPCPYPQSSHRPQPCFPAHLNSSMYDAEALREAAEEKERREESSRRGPPKHLNLDQYQLPLASPGTDLPVSDPPHSGERCQRDRQRPTVHGSCSHLFGMPLLRLPQPTHISLFPPSPRQPPDTRAEPGRPWTLSSASVQCPTSQQRCSNICQETQLPVFCPPRLIPAQDLIAFEQGRLCRSRHPSGREQAEAFRLLKVKIEPFEPRTDRDSKKRLKRRSEKRRTEKPVCKLRQSHKHLVPPDPTHGAETQKEPIDVPSVPDTTGGFAIPLGSCGALPADRDSVICPSVSAAELHCWASTRKSAEDRKDASTNTEQGREPCLRSPSGLTSCGKTGSSPIMQCLINVLYLLTVQQTPASVPQVQILPPDVFMNLRFPSEVYQKSLLTPTTCAAPDQAVPGHKFLNVIDIDAGELLNDLPLTTTVTELLPSSEGEGISIPGLHHMAASVTNTVPPDSCPAQESPPPGPVQPRSTDWEQQQAGDDLTQRLLLQDSGTVWAPPRPSAHTVGTRQVRAQLSEMEQQLSALQDMAVNMEQDFTSTKMLINTIEHLGSVIDPEGPMECSITRGVSAPDTGAAPQLLSDTTLEDEDRFYLKVVTAAGSPVSVSRHRRSPAPAPAPVAVHGFHPSADLNRSSREMESSTEDHLQVSGLSGVSDIIADLLNEGKLSAQAVGLTEHQAKKLSRCSKSPKRSEQERKEIQEWMKCKRQQRLETYREHREELKERDGAPCHPKEKRRNFTNKEIKENQKQNEVKKRVTLAENRKQRARAALSLMNEMLCDTVQLPTARLKPLGQRSVKSAQSTRSPYCSTPRGSRPASRSLSAGRAERSLSGTYSIIRRARSHSTSAGRALQCENLRQAAQSRPCPVTGSSVRWLNPHKQSRPGKHLRTPATTQPGPLLLTV